MLFLIKLKALSILWYSLALSKFKRLIYKNKPIPDADSLALQEVYSATELMVANLSAEATKFMKNMKEAKTQHKKDFYQRKFDRIKPKWQDEVNRLFQMKHILDENNIPLPPIDKKEK